MIVFASVNLAAAYLAGVLRDVFGVYQHIIMIIWGGLVLWVSIVIVRWIAGKSKRTFRR